MIQKIFTLMIVLIFAACSDSDHSTPQPTATDARPSVQELYFDACALILENLDSIKNDALYDATVKGVSLSDNAANEVVLKMIKDLPQRMVKAYGRTASAASSEASLESASGQMKEGAILEETLSSLVQKDLAGKSDRYYRNADGLYNARATSSAVYAYNARKSLGKAYDHVSYEYYHALSLLEQAKEVMASQLDAAEGLGYLDEARLQDFRDLLGSDNLEIHRDPDNNPMAFENTALLVSASDTDQVTVKATYHDYLYGRFLNGDLTAKNYSELGLADSIKTSPAAAGVVDDSNLLFGVTPNYSVISYSSSNGQFQNGDTQFSTESISKVAPNNSSGYLPSMAMVNFNDTIEDEIILIYNGVMIVFSWSETDEEYEILAHMDLPTLTPNYDSDIFTSVAAVFNEDTGNAIILVALSQNYLYIEPGDISPTIYGPGFWGTVYVYHYDVSSNSFSPPDSHSEFKGFAEGGETIFKYAPWLSVHTKKSDNPIKTPDQIIVNVGECTVEGYYGSRLYLYDENDHLKNLQDSDEIDSKEIGTSMTDSTMVAAFTNDDFYKTVYTGSFGTALKMDSVTTLQILPDIIAVADVPPCGEDYECSLIFGQSSSSGTDSTQCVSHGWTETTTVSMKESLFDVASIDESYASAVGYSESSSITKGTTTTAGLGLNVSSEKPHWYSSDPPSGSVYYSQYKLNKYSLTITKSPEADMEGNTLTFFGLVNSGTTYTDTFSDYETLTKIDLNTVTGHTPGDPSSYKTDNLLRQVNQDDPDGSIVANYYYRNSACAIPTGSADSSTVDCEFGVSSQQKTTISKTHTHTHTFTVGGGETISMDVIMKFNVNVSESSETSESTSHGITQSFSENNTLTFRYPQNAELYFAKNNCDVTPIIATYLLTNTNISQSLPTGYLSTTDNTMNPKDVFSVGTVAMDGCSSN
jgi:hypothetical protein